MFHPPTGSCVSTYPPLSPVTASRTAPVAACVALTVTLRTTPPEASDTEPKIVAVPWARTGAADNRIARSSFITGHPTLFCDLRHPPADLRYHIYRYAG